MNKITCSLSRAVHKAWWVALVYTASLMAILGGTLVLTGCQEQIQSARVPSGALTNFLLHLEAGELDDARAYFAPGLATPLPSSSPAADLDSALRGASERLRRYEISRGRARTQQLGVGEIRETIEGRVRLRPGTPPPPSQSTPRPDEGWQATDLITARMVERGPGWRILEYELKCCGQ